MVATVSKEVQLTPSSGNSESWSIRERIGDKERNRLQQAIAENRVGTLADLLRITMENYPQNGLEQFYRSVGLSDANVRRLNAGILDGSLNTLRDLIQAACEAAFAEGKASEANRVVPFGVRLSESGRIEEDDSLEISASSFNFTATMCGIIVPDDVTFDGVDP